jgi:Helix-turn-helix domain
MASQLLKESKAAEILDVKPTALRAWRIRGEGPEFVKIGAAVRYELSALEAFIAKGRRSSTSDGAA